MPSLRQYLLPHRLREFFVCCPQAFTTYATFHLDSINKILNHLLAVMLVGNILLWFDSWNVPTGAGGSISANGGLVLFGNSVAMIAFLLIVQTTVVWIILNNNNPNPYHHHGSGGGSIWNAFAPTEFMLGVALGITVGGSILAFCVSSAFARTPWHCKDNETGVNTTANNTTTTSTDPICSNPGSLTAVWFWSSLVFWVNFCVALLLAVGRRDLSINSSSFRGQYEHIGGEYDDVNDPSRNGGGGSFPGDLHSTTATTTTTSSFVGDYARIPEIRSGGGDDAGETRSDELQPPSSSPQQPPPPSRSSRSSSSNSSSESSPSSSSETTRIVGASVLSV